MAVAKKIIGKTTINILIVFILTTGNKIFVFLSLSEIFLPKGSMSYCWSMLQNEEYSNYTELGT